LVARCPLLPISKAAKREQPWRSSRSGCFFLVVLRAGIVEELFYRGYAIERLQLLGLNRWLAAVIPLLIFGFGHGTNGWANVVLALALGAVLTAFYLWRRDPRRQHDWSLHDRSSLGPTAAISLARLEAKLG
jgi:hypothetical protein